MTQSRKKAINFTALPPELLVPTTLINPRCMHEGYGSHFVCVCACVCMYICLSVIVLAATYLVYMLKMGVPLISYSVLKIRIVWILLKSLCLKVLATFADHLYLLHFLANSVNKRDSNDLLSRRLVGRFSDMSYNSTDSSLNIVNWQLAWLGFLTSSWYQLV